MDKKELTLGFEQQRLEEISNSASITEAAQFNAKVLRKLLKAFHANGEVDLTTQLPTNYSARLSKQKMTEEVKDEPPLKRARSVAPSSSLRDFRTSLLETEEVSSIFPISEALRFFLGTDRLSSTEFIQLLIKAEIIWTCRTDYRRTVFKINDSIAVKTVPEDADLTEYLSLEYLASQKPDFPSPKPHGVLRFDHLLFIFTSYVPGVTLESVWTKLSDGAKVSVQRQLNEILTDLRSLPFPHKSTLGGLSNSGCKDLRRDLRMSSRPISDAEGFEEFQFSNPHYGSKIYIQFLRQLLPRDQSLTVFTHGDLRPANIMVRAIGTNHYHVTGIVDWELSGFYPEWYEAAKITNCLSTVEKSDWFLYLPDCVSPNRYAPRWLLDRIWGPHIE